MKKIILKKQSLSEVSRKAGYKINYQHELNKSQYEAVMHNEGAALVIAGAGTGKTRTLVYRVARLIEDGVPPASILLLTFTRKAAAEMLRRASILLDVRAEKVSGGTFHSFAVRILRRWASHLGYEASFSILDQSDAEDVINLVRTDILDSKARKRFPQKSTLIKIHTLALNTQSSIKEIVEIEFPRFVEIIDEIEEVLSAYHTYKRKYNLMDYDDLLVNLLRLLKEKSEVRRKINSMYKFIMVDEYQDSNRLQHEIVLYLAGERQNAMAVGDDAQSIYSFRGAHFQNIINYPKSFASCQIFKIEENYRSSSQILNFCNKLMEAAAFKYDKELYSINKSGELPMIVSTASERMQSIFLVQQILEFREQGIPLENMTVLFRNAFHSFDLEIELERADIPYVKFGGIKFIETAHIKDLIAFARVLYNSFDAVSWQRILLLLDGIGPKSSTLIIDQIVSGTVTFDNITNLKIKSNRDAVTKLFNLFAELKESKMSVGDKMALFAEYYKPMLDKKHDDSKKRWRDVETFLTIAESYNSLEAFLTDMSLGPPKESVDELTPESKEEEFLTLSTIHSAKGLEWQIVFLIWTLEGRFPSARAADSIDSMEEERRLFYVACTRAKEHLILSYPTNIYERESGFALSEPSRFLADIDESFAGRYSVAEEDEDE